MQKIKRNNNEEPKITEKDFQASFVEKLNLIKLCSKEKALSMNEVIMKSHSTFKESLRSHYPKDQISFPFSPFLCDFFHLLRMVF